MSMADDQLRAIVSGNMNRKLPSAVTKLAAIIGARHEPGTLAVLAYGSCLRGTALTDSLIDFYVLTSDLRAISTNPFSRLLCHLVPPNVYYAEASIYGVLYRAKYAVLTLDMFERKVSAATSNPYFWARFAQPVALAWSRDDEARQRVTTALVTAVRTMLTNIAPLAAPEDGAVELWARGLSATYRSELRSEGPQRARQIADADADYYRAVTKAALSIDLQAGPMPDWPHIQRTGKVLSVARLIKAAFTFQGGAEYLAWKISRYSGQPLELTDWQRRHPVLAALTLLPKLLKSGAVK